MRLPTKSKLEVVVIGDLNCDINREVKHDVYGKRQGGPRDQFFPRFLTLAGCSLPFSTRREVVSRR